MKQAQTPLMDSRQGENAPSYFRDDNWRRFSVSFMISFSVFVAIASLTNFSSHNFSISSDAGNR
jgi:hypothetical protein